MKVTGVLEVKGSGYGFVRCENRDVYISSSMMNGAVHGQTVEAETELLVWGEAGGRITRILSPYPEMVGSVYRAYRKIYVHPINRRYPDISIPDGKTMDACSGDKVVVSVSGTVGESSMLEGSITEILGKKKDPGIDCIAVARSYGLKADFPKAAEKYANASTSEWFLATL